MALKIRLKRMGAKKAPFYRIVVAEAKTPRDGRFVEEIGYYDPIRKDLKVDNEAAMKWIKNGAQPTETAKSLLVKSGAIEAPKKNYKQTEKPAKKEATPEPKEAKTAAAEKPAVKDSTAETETTEEIKEEAEADAAEAVKEEAKSSDEETVTEA